MFSLRKSNRIPASRLRLGSFNDTRVYAIVSALILTHSIPAHALYADHCKSEMDQFCGDVVPGNSRLTNCMVEHEAKLPPACRVAVHATIEIRGGFSDACGADANRLCRDIPSGTGRLFACLRIHADDLNSACSGRIGSSPAQGGEL